MKNLISTFKGNSSMLWRNLPLYIKIGAIYYSILAVAYIVYLIGFLLGLFPQIGTNLYGITTKSLTSNLGLLIGLIYLLKAFIAYSLYKGKRFSILLGFIDGIFGVMVCLFIPLEPLFLDKLILPNAISFGILFLIPYAFIMGKFLFPIHPNVKRA